MPAPPTASNPTNESASEKKSRKQRLVPDLSDQIEASGQRLTRVTRVSRENSHELEPEPPAPKLTLENIARKHLDPKQARVIEENAHLLRALQEASEEPQEPSHAQAIAERMELFTDGAAVVPHPEPDAEKREETMSMSPLVGLDDAPDFLLGKAPPQTIFDLFSLFPQLDGYNWFIYVERKLPKTFSGRKVDGMLRPISAPLTLEQWQYWYGGGTYRLIVYGPSKRASVNMQADGRVQPKALTEAITVVFPGAPSSASEVYDGDDDMSQAPASGFPNIPLSGRRGPASMADAHIDKAQLEVTAAREIRSETREERERSEAKQALKEKAQTESSLMQMFMASQKEASAREAALREQMMLREREIADQRLADKEEFEERIRSLESRKQPDDLDRVAKIAGIIGKPDNSEAIREQHAREIERLQNAARDDAARAASLIKDAEARADLRIRDEQARSAERIREVEKRFETLERDLRDRADREVARAKEDGERRVSDMHRIHTDAMASEARNHARDVEGFKAQNQMAMESLKNTYDMRLETQKSEVKRTAQDVDRWKKEAEENKDPLGRIEKIKEQAEALGMVPADQAGAEPQTIPQMLMQMGGGLVQNLPGIVQNVGEMFKTRNVAELQAARAAGRAEMVEQAGQFGAERQLPPSHARRRAAPQLASGGGSGYVPRHMSEVNTAPVVLPGMDPYAIPPQPQFQPAQEVHVEQSPNAFAPPISPQMQPLASVMPMQPQYAVQIPAAPPPPAPSPSVAPPQTVPPPEMPSAADQQAFAEDQQLLQAEQMLAPQYAASVPVPILAEHLLTQFGPEVVADLVSKVDAERVVLAITRSGHPDSPFLRRDGKKYLRALFDELKKKVSGA
ncbi:MAG TPA: hypothetical protein VK571_07815 [Gemmatimonadaceae bacterium]|nr:hypothetical protein [Gemmatimonadaceae bacterium]